MRIEEAHWIEEALRRHVLAALPPVERDMLRLRFGLGDGECLTLAEIGQVYGITREAVRQREKRAMRKLQAAG